jgi:serine/threonine-protein kinase PpkA
MSSEPLRETEQPFPATEAVPLDVLFGVSSLPADEPAVRTEPPGTLATFMYARLRNFGPTCETMAGAELTTFLNEVRRMLSAAALQLGGEIAQRRPDSILCVFSDKPEDKVPVHAKRALHAAIVTVHESVQLASRVAARPLSAGLPPLSISIGVHLGAGEVAARSSSNHGMVRASGEAVEIARLLQLVAADQHWSVVASLATRQAGGDRVESGRRGTLGLPDDSFLEVAEIAALVQRKGSATPPSHYEQLRESLQRNRQLARAAANADAAANPGSMHDIGHVLIEDYRLIRKIGEGGIATVYLAQPMAGGPVQVLKVMRLDSAERLVELQRFIQEFALVAQIDHPNVAHIFGQDFSAGSAYIAMEYFPMGDMRARMRQPIDPAIALYYLRQIASGLEAIHQVGIVHRDLKPDNVMMRQDGILAIADFGIAKQVSMQITDTGAGDVVGTPYYLSPEQACGKPVDARCDIYSLGVVAYEMLTGAKPYYAATAQELLQLHINAPVPKLPATLARFQPVLDKMMAKDREQRFESAAALLDALQGLGQ